MKRNILVSFVVIVALIIAVVGCDSSGAKDDKLASKKDANRKALRIIGTNCFSCHSPDREITEQSRLAPQLYKIRDEYMNASDSKEQFINKMTDYMLEPMIDKSIMESAVEKYGLMPRTQLPENTIRDIVTYIYENEMTAEQWSKAGKMANTPSE